MRKFFIIVVTLIGWIVVIVLAILHYVLWVMWVNLYYHIGDNMRQMLVMLPQDARELLRLFDTNGLRHNSVYLDTIRRKIIFWTTEEQAEFADFLTVSMINKKTYKNSSIAAISQKTNENLEGFFFEEINYICDNLNGEVFSNMNATSIGNLAYAGLYHNRQDVRGKCMIILVAAKEYFGSFGFNK